MELHTMVIWVVEFTREGYQNRLLHFMNLGAPFFCKVLLLITSIFEILYFLK